MDSSHIQGAILFADISGSTALYERLGDVAARKAVTTCLGALDEVTRDFDGEVIEIIGDEIERTVTWKSGVTTTHHASVCSAAFGPMQTTPSSESDQSGNSISWRSSARGF